MFAVGALCVLPIQLVCMLASCLCRHAIFLKSYCGGNRLRLILPPRRIEEGRNCLPIYFSWASSTTSQLTWRLLSRVACSHWKNGSIRCVSRATKRQFKQRETVRKIKLLQWMFRPIPAPGYYAASIYQKWSGDVCSVWIRGPDRTLCIYCLFLLALCQGALASQTRVRVPVEGVRGVAAPNCPGVCLFIPHWSGGCCQKKASKSVGVLGVKSHLMGPSQTFETRQPRQHLPIIQVDGMQQSQNNDLEACYFSGRLVGRRFFYWQLLRKNLKIYFNSEWCHRPAKLKWTKL